jgi:hypothetical protein
MLVAMVKSLRLTRVPSGTCFGAVVCRMLEIRRSYQRTHQPQSRLRDYRESFFSATDDMICSMLTHSGGATTCTEREPVWYWRFRSTNEPNQDGDTKVACFRALKGRCLRKVEKVMLGVMSS